MENIVELNSSQTRLRRQSRDEFQFESASRRENGDIDSTVQKLLESKKLQRLLEAYKSIKLRYGRLLVIFSIPWC